MPNSLLIFNTFPCPCKAEDKGKPPKELRKKKNAHGLGFTCYYSVRSPRSRQNVNNIKLLTQSDNKFWNHQQYYVYARESQIMPYLPALESGCFTILVATRARAPCSMALSQKVAKLTKRHFTSRILCLDIHIFYLQSTHKSFWTIMMSDNW